MNLIARLHLIVLAMLFSPILQSESRAVQRDSQWDNAEPLEPMIKEIRVEKVRALTGPDSSTAMKPLDVCGTDLGG
jgi:hypothetical protein